jgi:hypothetical protein
MHAPQPLQTPQANTGAGTKLFQTPAPPSSTRHGPGDGAGGFAADSPFALSYNAPASASSGMPPPSAIKQVRRAAFARLAPAGAGAEQSAYRRERRGGVWVWVWKGFVPAEGQAAPRAPHACAGCVGRMRVRRALAIGRGLTSTPRGCRGCRADRASPV